jgi:chemotaxis protein MotB
MRLLALLLLLPACAPPPATFGPDAPAQTAPEVDQLRLENERLRRLLAAETSAAGDCPAPQDAYRGETVDVLLADVYFESGSAELTADGRSRLAQLAQRLDRDYAGRRIRVEGHTDSQRIGPTLARRFATNWELSTARATAVVRFLESQGLRPERLEATGLASHSPIADNTTSEGRARNRRVRVAALD